MRPGDHRPTPERWSCFGIEDHAGSGHVLLTGGTRMIEDANREYPRGQVVVCEFLSPNQLPGVPLRERPRGFVELCERKSRAHLNIALGRLRGGRFGTSDLS